MSLSGTNPAELGRKPKPIPSARRRRVRHGVYTPAYVGFNDSPGAVTLDLSEVVDISEDGACIQTTSPLEVNRTLNLCLDLSEAKARINTIGLVVWSGPSGRAGIRFVEMSDASLRSLREWLFINALTACDQAASQTSPPRPEFPQLASADMAMPAAAVEQPVPSGPPVLADDSQTLVAPAAAQERVEPVAGSDLDRLLHAIAERALTSIGATGAAIALSRGLEMICAARAGSDAPSLGVRLQVGSGFSGACVRSRHLLRCEDSETDSRVDREACRVLGIRSMVAVPVFSDDAVAGLLEVFSPAARAFSGVPDAAFEYFSEEISAVLSRSTSPPLAKRELLETRATNRRPVSSPLSVPDRKPEYSIRAIRSDQPPAPRSLKMIFVATAAALVVAALSLVVPRVRHGIGIAGPSKPVPSTQPQIAVSQPAVPSVAAAEDFPSLRKLAEQGDPGAQFAVGRRFATGEDVKQDYAEAVRWFAMAAEQGHIVAQATLGAYYWAGRGVPQDLTKAYYWSILAQAGGDQASKYRVAVLTSRMTRSQVLAAQQDANDWLTHHQLTGKPSPQIR